MSRTLAPKDPDVAATYTIDWHDELVDTATRRADVVLGAIVRYPHVDTGYYYEVTTAGRLSQFFPDRIPRGSGETVVDGSAVLTARHPSAVSLTAISSAAWSVPAGITQDAQSEDGFSTHITLSGGTDGEDYELTCQMTPSAGNAIEQSIVVPVRSQ